MPITITITADTADEALRTMREFAPTPIRERFGLAPTKPKRKRRTNAEIDADNSANNSAKSGVEQVRDLLGQIEKKHGATGIARASGLVKAALEEQGEPYGKIRVSNLNDSHIWPLAANLEKLADEDVDDE